MAVAALFGLIAFLPIFLFIPLVFPEETLASLVFLYHPETRIALILFLLSVYFFKQHKKKYTSHTYDYLDDLSMRDGHVKGLAYHFIAFSGGKNNVATNTVYVDGDYGYDFTLKFENKFEKTLKFLRLSYECQSGDKKFDDMIYIVSDDKLLCKDLQEDSDLRKKYLHYFGITKNQVIKLILYNILMVELSYKLEENLKMKSMIV